MANIRFLDQVPVASFATTQTQGRLPRVLNPGDVLIVYENQQMIGYDFYNLGGIVIIQSGSLIPGTDIYTHGLLQIEDTFDNQGTVINDGYLVLGSELQ